MHRPPRAILAAIATAASASASIAQPVVIDFEAMPPDQPPSGFTTAVTGDGAPGEWLVREEPGAPSGTHALTQVSSAPARAQFPLAIHDGLTAADVELSVSFKPLSGSIDQAAGLVWRYLDEDNYYIVRANALEGNVVAYKVENGERTDLPLVGQGDLRLEAEVPSNEWSTLGVRMTGDRFTVSLNGTDLFEVQDQTFTEPGKVGLWTKADSVTAFDDLTITPLR